MLCLFSPSKEMKSEVRKVRDYQGLNAFVLIILTHGIGRFISGADGKPIDIKSSIITPLNGVNWSQMSGKPKVFVIHSSLGKLI